MVGRFIAKNQIAVVGVREEIRAREEHCIVARDCVAVAVALFHLKPNSIFGCVFCGARLAIAVVHHAITARVDDLPVGFEKSGILFLVGRLYLDTVDMLFHVSVAPFVFDFRLAPIG